MLLGLLSCKEALARLDDFVDRELAPDELRLVERHMRICVGCAQKYRFEEGFVREVRSKIEHLETPADLMARIRADLQRVSILPPGDPAASLDDSSACE